MESESTVVTGSPAGLKGPRPGDVVCERFEIRDVAERDGLVQTLRAVDQETDQPVVVRVTAPGLLEDRESRRVLERLRPLIGSRGEPDGASLWPGMLDVDREGSLVLTVEPWPKGTSFRAVLEARRAKGKRFDAAELLPFIARIAAALDGLPDRSSLAGLYHGDLRAGRVFVHPDGMSITGGFLLAALPGDAVADVLTRDVVLRRALPPEFADGLAGRPADRYAVAALAWEALEGAPPPPSVRPADCRSEPALGAILVRYLDPDPAARPATLRGLVDALAARANLPIPEHRDRLVLRGGLPPTSSEESHGETVSFHGEPAAADGKTEVASADTTQPRGVDLDPDLVRAAKAADAISETGTFQLDGQELLPVSALTAAAAKPLPATAPEAAKRVARPTQKMGELPAPKPPAPRAVGLAAHQAVPPPAPAAVLPRRAADRTQELADSDLRDVATPAARIKQKKGPSPMPASSPLAQAVQAAASAEAARPRPAWEHAQLPPSEAPLPSLQPAETRAPAHAANPAALAQAGLVPAAMAPMPSGETHAGVGGIAMIVTAVVLATLILGGAFWYRAHQDQVRREQEIEQGLRDLQQ